MRLWGRAYSHRTRKKADMMAAAIREYDALRDEASVYALWQRTLGAQWPVSRAVFHHTTVGSDVYKQGDHFVATTGYDGTIIGFVATQARSLQNTVPEQQPPGELMVIIVDPTYQRQGIGRALLSHALSALKHRGLTKVQLGAGGVSYFWPGVPANLAGAWSFFMACGWPLLEASFDLSRSLEDYATPPGSYERIRLPGISLAIAGAADMSELLLFEERHFPRWLGYYELLANQGAYSDVLLAKDSRVNEIVGASMVMDFRVPRHQHGFRWRQLLDESVGGIGTLGVAEERRGHGIGLALAARATEILQERGVVTSYIGYTWLVDWYGRLGYQVWRQYHMSQMTL